MIRCPAGFGLIYCLCADSNPDNAVSQSMPRSCETTFPLILFCRVGERSLETLFGSRWLLAAVRLEVSTNLLGSLHALGGYSREPYDVFNPCSARIFSKSGRERLEPQPARSPHHCTSWMWKESFCRSAQAFCREPLVSVKPSELAGIL